MALWFVTTILLLRRWVDKEWSVDGQHWVKPVVLLRLLDFKRSVNRNCGHPMVLIYWGMLTRAFRSLTSLSAELMTSFSRFFSLRANLL